MKEPAWMELIVLAPAIPELFRCIKRSRAGVCNVGFDFTPIKEGIGVCINFGEDEAALDAFRNAVFHVLHPLGVGAWPAFGINGAFLDPDEVGLASDPKDCVIESHLHSATVPA
ncbi:MAG: hypothetical protein WCS99_22725 [Limisphaerales bacterium]